MHPSTAETSFHRELQQGQDKGETSDEALSIILGVYVTVISK